MLILLCCWGQTSLSVVVQQQPVECVSSHWLPLACIKSRSGKFNQIHCAHPPRRTAVTHRSSFPLSWAASLWYFPRIRDRNGIEIQTMKERRNTQPLVVRCKLVLVGDVQCGKTAMLQVLAKDCYPEVITDTTVVICTISRVFASWRSLLNRWKMAEESVRTLRINHAHFPNT